MTSGKNLANSSPNTPANAAKQLIEHSLNVTGHPSILNASKAICIVCSMCGRNTSAPTARARVLTVSCATVRSSRASPSSVRERKGSRRSIVAGK